MLAELKEILNKYPNSVKPSKKRGKENSFIVTGKDGLHFVLEK